MPPFGAAAKPRLLKLADYQDTVLRQPTESVKFPLSDQDKKIILDMKYSIQPKQLKAANAPWDAAVGMAANQWGLRKSIFLYCPEGDTEKGLEVIINPDYQAMPDSSGDETHECTWEGCFSVPLASCKMVRHSHIRVTYQNEAGVRLRKELSGWYARVWQHENDHLRGFLLDDPRTGQCLEKKEFKSNDEVDRFYDSLRDENADSED